MSDQYYRKNQWWAIRRLSKQDFGANRPILGERNFTRETRMTAPSRKCYVASKRKVSVQKAKELNRMGAHFIWHQRYGGDLQTFTRPRSW
jgi:hypothetical protein